MKISLGAKVNYYSKCPFCGTARAEGSEKCINCGKDVQRPMVLKVSVALFSSVSMMCP